MVKTLNQTNYILFQLFKNYDKISFQSPFFSECIYKETHLKSGNFIQMDLNTYRFGLVLFHITILFSNSGARNVTAQISHVSTSIVLDVGQISEDYLQNQNPIHYKLKSYIEIISKRNAGNYSSSQFLLHFKISNQVLNHYKITSIGNVHKPFIDMLFFLSIV